MIRVERNGEVRLRIINAGASSNFTIDLGNVQGTLVAVDGNPIAPLPGRRFPVAIAQRADVVLRMPADGAAVPILALGEGRRLRTGIILQPPGAAVAKISANDQRDGAASRARAGIGAARERAAGPKACGPFNSRRSHRHHDGLRLGHAHQWDGRAAGDRDRGERVEIAFRNTTMMSHPMHLHGHVFQVVEVNGKPIRGAIRDTILVPPKATVKVAFDADNPGLWAFHCHNLYHMAAGMFGTLVYRGFS